MSVGTHVVSHFSFIGISPGYLLSEVAQWETWITSKISLIETGISGAGAAKMESCRASRLRAEHDMHVWLECGLNPLLYLISFAA